MPKTDRSLFFDITISEKMLLHLLDHFQISEDYTQPVAVTQEGIASAVAVQRSHVSYCLKQMQDNELIVENLKHIENKTRRLKAYSLTPKGYKDAIALRKRILDSKVQYKNGEGIHEERISSLLSKGAMKLSLVEIMEQTRKNGFVERSKEVNPATRGKQVEKNLFFVKNVQVCPHFTGRKNEISILSDWLDSRKCSVYVVHGMAGIGKTSLGYQIISEARNKFHSFWYTCEVWTTGRAIALSVAEFFEQMGNGHLSVYLKGTIDMDLSLVHKEMEAACSNEKFLFILDDTQKIAHDESSICEMFIKLAFSMPNIKLLILSRKLPHFYSAKEVLIHGNLGEMHLEGLKFEDCITLLKNWGILSEERSSLTGSKIYELTKGHPLALELVKARKVEKNMLRDITRFFQEEVMRTLSREEEDMLELAAVYRSSIPYAGLFLDGGHYRTLDALLERSLIKETDDGYSLHDVLKGVIEERLAPQRRRKLHKLIADHLHCEADAGNMQQALESCYHYFEGGDFNGTADMALEFGVALFGEGLLAETLSYIDRLTNDNGLEKRMPDEERYWALLCLKGNLLTVTGKLEEAERLLHEVDERCKYREKADLVHAKAHNGLGIISYKNKCPDRAIENYQEAISIAKQCNNKRYVAKVSSNLGVLHGEMGNLEMAGNSHRKAMELCWEIEDKEGVARAYNNLGILSFTGDDLPEAVRMFQKGLEISQNIGNMRIAAVACNNLGDAYVGLNNVQLAKKYYFMGLEISEKFDFKWQQVEALEALGKLFEGEKARIYAEKAGKIQKMLGIKGSIE